MFVDLREPNKAVIVDSFLLQHMDELLATLKGSTVFTTVDLLSVKDNFVFRGSRLIAPVAHRPMLVAVAHQGHQGEMRTKRLCDVYWWPGMDTSVHDFVRSCNVCQLNDKTVKSHPVLFVSAQCHSACCNWYCAFSAPLQKVTRLQRKMKRYTDTKRSAPTPYFQEVDKV